MNAKTIKAIRKQYRFNGKAMAENVQELYQRASELPFSRRWIIAWNLLIGKRDWSGK